MVMLSGILLHYNSSQSQNQESRVTDEAHPDKDGLFLLAIDYRITVHEVSRCF
jgi:hypothetical protein